MTFHAQTLDGVLICSFMVRLCPDLTAEDVLMKIASRVEPVIKASILNYVRKRGACPYFDRDNRLCLILSGKIEAPRDKGRS